MDLQFKEDVGAGVRFPFGENWLRFLSRLTDDKLFEAGRSLQEMLLVESLQGKSFLDIGSGSGLFSLAARKLGASVHSLDNDPQSVSCTNELKRRYFPDDACWTVEQGSVLEKGYLAGLGKFDVVYSWGVLHHTGDMYKAFSNILTTVKPGGKLLISVYNDQGWRSRYWSFIKRSYNQNRIYRLAIIVMHAPFLFGIRYLVRAIRGHLALPRGMSMWRDTFDWLGGYPFEVAKPEKVFAFFRDHGFVLEKIKTCGGRTGCNEFLFRQGLA